MNHDLPLALYGAGKNAAIEKAAVEKSGYDPVCFIDADVSKQGCEYLGLPVLSLNEAKRKYGQFNLHVTVGISARFDIFEYLLQQGIQKEKILNYETYERYIGRRWSANFKGKTIKTS